MEFLNTYRHIDLVLLLLLLVFHLAMVIQLDDLDEDSLQAERQEAIDVLVSMWLWVHGWMFSTRRRWANDGVAANVLVSDDHSQLSMPLTRCSYPSSCKVPVNPGHSVDRERLRLLTNPGPNWSSRRRRSTAAPSSSAWTRRRCSYSSYCPT